MKDVTLECFNFKRQNALQNAKGLLSTSIVSSAITAAEQLLEEMHEDDAQLNFYNH